MTVQRYHSWDSEDDEDGHYVAHDDYAALLKERDALAVENASLKGREPLGYIKAGDFKTLSEGNIASLMPNNVFGESPVYRSIETPATDAAIANIRAQGVDELADFAGKEYQRFVGDKPTQRKWKGIVLLCTDFAAQLRKEPDHD